MRLVSRSLAGFVAGALLLAACSGGHGGGSLPAVGGATPTQPYTGPQQLANFAWGESLAKQLPQMAPSAHGTLSLVVQMQMRNAQGLMRYASEASNPSSPLYRHWLTPQQIADTYGASASDYSSTAAYFTGNGLRVGMWPQREVLTVSGTTQQLEKAFGTKFGLYQFKGKGIIAPVSTPHFTRALPVVAVAGLIGANGERRYIIHGTSATFFGLSPQVIGAGLDFGGAYNAGLNGTGINVGIIGTGPIINADGKDDDLAAFSAFWHAPMASVTQVVASPQPASTANGGTGTGVYDAYPNGLASPPPLTAPCQQSSPADYTTCNPEDGEAQLDTESVASLAPGANMLFYMAYNPSQCLDPSGFLVPPDNTGACPSGDVAYPMEGIALSDDEIQQAIADNRADVLSLSYGLPENWAQFYGLVQGPATGGQPGIEEIEFASLAAEGTAVFVSSGDDGAWECQDPVSGAWLGTACASYPATDPNVVSVGAIDLPVDERGNLIGEIMAWADDTTNGGDGSFGNNVGSGGGISTVFTSPSWQSATVGASMREIPDISLNGDPNSGPSILQNAGFTGYQATYAIGGTSAAAPEAAAQWGIVLQACKASSTCNQGGAVGYRLGNPAPLYYAIYATSSLATGSYTAGSFTPQLNYSQVFADVLYGTNQAIPSPQTPAPATTPGGFNSGPGYDMVTGLGAPFTGHLVQAITGTKVP